MADSSTSSSTEAGSSFKIVRGHGISKCADYSVAWICALRDTELLAARVLLDEEHTTPPYNTEYDRNTYICGKIGEHKVVVACLPSGRSGNVSAGHLTGPLFHTFPNVKVTLLVGIGGGVPRQEPQDPLEDIYLGDVIIGWPGDGTPAVVQYDLGRWKVDGFEQRGSVDQPSSQLIQALDMVISNHQVGQTDFLKSIARLRKIPKFASRRPDEDKLFRATYKHEGDYYSQCRDCNPTNLIKRPGRAEARPDGLFKFQQGTIASGGAVIQDGEIRDRLSRACNNARCLEMEAVGVNDNSRCLVIRGLADYADSHKNDVWKYVAAGNAAAFAKELLLTIKGSGLRELSGIVPDQRKPISTLPNTFSIDPDFVGRDDVLKTMDDHFTRTNCVTLVGLGGIGKTEIAVQYCHNYRQKTPESHIFWVYGSTRQSFDDAYRRIATELEIPGCEDSLFEQRKAVPRELGRRETGPWLMIVDNADEYSIYFPPHDKALSESEQSEYLAYCLPYGAENGGRLIVTTRNTRVGADIMDDSPIIEIPKLAPVDARKLLGSRVPKEKWEDYAADELLQELDYLPLAITQAAAFVKKHKGISLRFYLGKLRQPHLNAPDVLSMQLHDSRRQPGTPNAVFRTWQISYHQIEVENTEAANKLSLMAVLDRQAVPRALLASRDDWEEVAELEALQVLLDFSLIQGDAEGEFFSMHPLQQLSTRNWLRLNGSRLKAWEDRGLMLLAQRMPNLDMKGEERRHACSILLPHARTVVSYETKNLDCRSRLLLKMSSYEGWLGRNQDCYQHALQAYEDSCEVHGETSEETLDFKLGVMLALANLNRYNEAARLQEEVEPSGTGQLKEAEIAYQSACRILVQEPERLATAFAFLQEALDRFKARFSNERVRNCLYMQAAIAKRQGRADESENLYRQALRESGGVSGENHSPVLMHILKMGNTVQEHRFAETVQLLLSTIGGKEASFGLENPRTMERKGYLAFVLDRTGHLAAAESLGRRVLKYSQRNLGSHHWLTHMVTKNLIITLRKLRRPEEAEQMNRMLMFNSRIAPMAFGTDSGSISFTPANLLHAEQMLHKALAKSQEQIGPEHPDNSLKLSLLAECLEFQNKWEGAEKYRRKCLEILEQLSGNESLGNIVFHKKLAGNLSAQGKREAASLHLQDVLQRMKRLPSKDTTKIHELEDFCCDFTNSRIPGQGSDDAVAEPAPTWDALIIPSADHERHQGSKVSSAEVQGH